MRGNFGRSLPLTLLLALALAPACSDSKTATPDMAAPLAPAFRGTLDLDIRDRASLALLPTGATTFDVELTLMSGGSAVIASGEKLLAKGRIDPFPEARTTLYSARFSLPPIASGPCAGKPVSVALSLVRREDNDRVAGGLSAYCGEGTFSGTPIRVLRLSGPLPFVP